MKTKIETTTKTTVTLSVEEFLERLNLDESGNLLHAIVQPEYVDGVGIVPAKVAITFEHTSEVGEND